MRKVIIAILFFIVGFLVSSYWYSLNNPMKPLYVEVLNDTDAMIPSVIIEFGSSKLQQKIMLLQLEPKETRTVAINHKPGMGFNIAANYANGEKTYICAGKNKGYWFFRETITKFGIYNTPIR